MAGVHCPVNRSNETFEKKIPPQCVSVLAFYSQQRPFYVEYGAAKMAFGCCQWPNDLDQCPLTAPLCHKSTRQILPLD